MVRAIAQLARAMNITTVAEYVETEEIRTRVRTLGVDYGQGFAIARPVPVGEVLDVLPVLAAATPGAFLLDEPARQRRAELTSDSRFGLGFAPMKLLLIGIVIGVRDRRSVATLFAHRERDARAHGRRARTLRRGQAASLAAAEAAQLAEVMDRVQREYVDRRVRSPSSSTMRCAASWAGSTRIPLISTPRNTPTCA